MSIIDSYNDCNNTANIYDFDDVIINRPDQLKIVEQQYDLEPLLLFSCQNMLKTIRCIDPKSRLNESGYSSKTECSSPENKTNRQNDLNRMKNNTKMDHLKEKKPPIHKTTLSLFENLILEEQSLQQQQDQQRILPKLSSNDGRKNDIDKYTSKEVQRLSPINDESSNLATNYSSNNKDLITHQCFPTLIPSNNDNSSSSLLTHNSKVLSPKTVRRHCHVYDEWTRLSFYDNVETVPQLITSLPNNEPLIIEVDQITTTNTSTSSPTSSHDDKRVTFKRRDDKQTVIEQHNSPSNKLCDVRRTQYDRNDSGLGTSSVERQIDTENKILSDVEQSSHRQQQRSSSTASSLSASSSSISSKTSNTNNVTTTSSSSSNRLPTSRRFRVKWHSFTKSHRPSFNSSKYHVSSMSVGQLFALRRAASIRIQELLDRRHISTSNNTLDSLTVNVNYTSNNNIPVVASPRTITPFWSHVPKLIIRRHRKENHHNTKEIKKSVFGVSLMSMTQKTGHPVPTTILSAMKYLRRTSIDSVGIFRKPGVSNRIKRLHELIESDLEFHNFDDYSPYDVADVIKQYFRCLPENLFTTKLSSVFLNISEHFSSPLPIESTTIKINNEKRLRTLQYAILLLPDEHRLVLHLLLSFLNDVSKHSKTNQMSAINLATCFAPTLFSFRQYNQTDIMSPRAIRKLNNNTSSVIHNGLSIAATPILGMPDYREIHEQRKAMEILSCMIENVRLLFLVPDELHKSCQFSYIEIGEPCTLDELSRRVTENANSSSVLSQSTNQTTQKYRRCSSSNLVYKRSTTQQRAATQATTYVSASSSIGSLSSSASASSSCENMISSDNSKSNKTNNNNNNRQAYIKASSSSRLFSQQTSSSGCSSSSFSQKSNYKAFIDRCIDEIMRESCHTKVKGWQSFGKNNEIELAYKKLDDGCPLSLWKCTTTVEAPPLDILNRLLYERNLWDADFQNGTIIELLNKQTHVYQYIVNELAPLVSRYFVEIRSWRTNIQMNNGQQSTTILNQSSTQSLTVGSSSSASSSAIQSFTQQQQQQKRDSCVLVCTSIEHSKAHCPPTLVRAVTLASRYLIQSYGCGKSKITHLSRVDLMGRSTEWYQKAYGSILIRYMNKIKESFAHSSTNSDGPETKV
ncbi:unnamed protein product [Didymodactylos carnosus]|uniref:Uncharacterized protein n=1 Tax=Didymodactylos carnosus TaxID=1234261 RepID=A0A813QYP2_9BILA|nr:unnamed protein product [Didymodactylos carnosus]CAF0773548.1 unnamed protein product [Didymodactylos carnosus]CAF3507763.1 unnamed protein product [Didymodactylos carnosus]CAF3555926.1 unnamed protein product [Didymodactylos carnosus]